MYYIIQGGPIKTKPKLFSIINKIFSIKQQPYLLQCEGIIFKNKSTHNTLNFEIILTNAQSVHYSDQHILPNG